MRIKIRRGSHNLEAVKICVQQIKDQYSLHIYEMEPLDSKSRSQGSALPKLKQPNVLTLALMASHLDQDSVDRERLKKEMITALLDMIFDYSVSHKLLSCAIEYLLSSESNVYIRPKIGSVQMLKRSEALGCLINVL